MLLAVNDSDLKLLALFSLILAGIVLLTTVIYVLCALLMRGKHHLCFQMDESAVALVGSARSKDTVNALAGIATAAAFAAGKPGDYPYIRDFIMEHIREKARRD